jgi:hypothetical protein
MTVPRLVAGYAVAIMLGGGAVLAEQGRGREGRGGDRDTYFHRNGYARLNIPPGHFPPPGECRVWHPGRQPGQQPPPGRCDRVHDDLPLGAWILRRPSREHVHVVVYDERRPKNVLVVGQFRVANGVFVGIVVDK